MSLCTSPQTLGTVGEGLGNVSGRWRIAGSSAPVVAARGGRARVLEVQHGRRRRRAHVRRRPVRVLRKRWQRSRRRKRGVASRLVLWQHDALSAPLRRTCPLVHVCRVGNVAMTTWPSGTLTGVSWTCI